MYTYPHRQLLYHPFNAFFVIFGNIIQAPLSVNHDLSLLRSTVSYYTVMASQGGAMANRLKRVAHIFASLAEIYVQDARSKTTTSNVNGSLSVPTEMSFEGLGHVTDTSYQESSTSSSVEGFVPLDFNVYADDNLLNWFTSSEFTYQPEPFGQDFLYVEQEQSYLAQDQMTQAAEAGATMSQADLFKSLEEKGRKRPLECTFDWFSWDMYN